VEVWAGDEHVATWSFRDGDVTAPRTIVVPDRAVDDTAVLALTFVIRRPRSPFSLGMSDDERRLGIFVRSLVS
jgi:hypothetical protein